MRAASRRWPGWRSSIGTTCPGCGGDARRETDVSDTFLDSGWYFLRYPSTEFDDRPFDDARTREWLPVESYIGGEEHSVLHLLYSRFLIMVLHDLGVLEFEEPYKQFRKHGMLIKEGAKISKSRGNVILPDRVHRSIRGRHLSHVPDVPRAVSGGRGLPRPGDRGSRALSQPGVGQRDGSCAGRLEGTAPEPAPQIEKALHRTIKKVTGDLDDLSYNTAIAALMDYMNAIRAEGRTPSLEEVRPLVVMLAPMAPHIAEELWERTGGEPSLFDHASWPSYDPAMLEEDEVDLPVQVNGKLRATVRVGRGASQDAVQEAALRDENVGRHIEGAAIRKVIHVPDRLINFVVG